MLAAIAFTPWHWAGFLAFVALMLALDLGVFHGAAHVVKFKEALCWTLLWITLAMLFAAGIWFWDEKKDAIGFLTGYFVELSLSMDNVFVIAMVFTYFSVPQKYQHRVLVWGVLGAVLMRGVMIWLGVRLINRFQGLLYVFGAFLVFTGVKMLLKKDANTDPEKNPVVRLARRLLPFAPDFDGQKFVTRRDGRLLLTPLFLVLLTVETTDLLFALDSIPAIFGITRVPFIVFTSNIFAILGLRSLYFVLAGAIDRFRYLTVGLSAVLVFIGVKMLIDPHDHPPRWFQYDLPDGISLCTVMGILAVSIVASMVAARRERAGEKPGEPS
jgi:tellurite resistance protein TerC